MKKLLSLLLAVLMVVALVPAAILSATAAETTTEYVAYEQDFEAIAAGTTGVDLLGALGWYVPDSKVDTNGATYSIVSIGTNKVLRVNTLDAEAESFVNIFGGEVMSILGRSDFTLSYRLTYRAETTDANGYASIIYNYNGMNGATVSETGNEAYGIVAVRMCGTGFNSVYYPATGSECAMHSLEKALGSANVMENGYDPAAPQTTLYARLFSDGAEAGKDKAVMADKIVNIKLVYSYEQGVTVYVNDQLVSESVHDDQYNEQISNQALWSDFVARNIDGNIVALLTTPGVVADIDNIRIVADSLDTTATTDLPNLLITEIAGYPLDKKLWTQFIEIYNPTDEVIDLANYSILRAPTAAGSYGYATDALIRDGSLKYDQYVNLGELFGTAVESGAFYKTEAEIATMATHTYRILDTENFYKLNAETGAYELDNENGKYRMMCYIDNWNTRYDYANADYNTNTKLNPGECLIIHVKRPGEEVSWQNLTNAGDLSQTIASSGFRKEYSGFGLSANTKVVTTTDLYIDYYKNNTFYVAAAYDENGNEIVYTDVLASDHSTVESYVEWNPVLAVGSQTPDSAQAGWVGQNYSAVYVYGIDVSRDIRYGHLYAGLLCINSGSRSWVGKLAPYQEMILEELYKQDAEPAKLSITEIIPRTKNLAGEDKNAFSAIELTNTSDAPLNVYDYALARSHGDSYMKAGEGFAKVVKMQAGNPVAKLDTNAGYYNFVETHVKNPDTCVLQPGETMVVWFINQDTYSSYGSDFDFGVNYFRQYWANNGSPDMALRAADGEYVVKVIAVDGNQNEFDNGINAGVVFTPNHTQTCMYGVVDASAVTYHWEETYDRVDIPSSAIESIAYGGYGAAYYGLECVWGLDYKGQLGIMNQLFEGKKIKPDYHTSTEEVTGQRFPANMGIHYVVGLNGSGKVSAMVKSLAVMYMRQNAASGKDVVLEEYVGQVPLNVEFDFTNGLLPSGLGALEGIEAYTVRDNLDGVRTNVITTLETAAVTTGETTEIRFHSAIKEDVYVNLATKYAGTFKAGMLIVKSTDLKDGVALTKQGLDAAGIAYQDVASEFLYTADEMVVLGSSITLTEADFATRYVAVAYMEYDGQVVWSATSASRSAAKVARSALKDIVDVQSDEYAYEVEGKFSPYSEAERTVLANYMK